MKRTSRFLSLLLAFVMLVGMLPMSVLADETGTEPQATEETQAQETTAPVESPSEEPTGEATEAPSEEPTEASAEEETTSEDDGIMTAAAEDGTIYVLAGGDFQEAGDHTASAQNITNILSVITGLYPTMDGFLFIGDYDCETHGDSSETDAGISKLMETIQASYSNINHDNSILAQGNHDATHQYIDGSTTGTYGYDLNGYAAFVFNEDQYVNGGGTQSGVQSLADKLDTWLGDKVIEKYNKPIFIVSHLPLAFTTRTNVQGDGKYAKLLFDVLQEYADKGLNIIFLHGHNHAYGYDEYLGGHAIYLAKGDSINIAELGSQSSYTTETLKFTYMNAGYTGYYNESGYTTSNAGTDKLSMTVFAITDSQVTVGRYSADGAINLKVAGESKGDYIDRVDVDLNTAVYTTTQTIALTEVNSDSSTGDSGSGSEGSTEGWVQVSSASDASGYQYTLDTDGIDYGTDNQYIIVASDAAYALTPSGGAESITISGNTATATDRDNDFYFYDHATYGDIITNNGTDALYQQNNGIHLGYRSGGLLNGFTRYNNGLYRIYDTQGTYWTMYYNNGWTVADDDSYRVRLYKYSGAVTGGSDLWASIDGELNFEFASGTTQAQAEAAIKAAITGYTSASADGSDPTTLDDSDLTWTWTNGFNTAGNSTMTVSYNGTTLGTVTAHVAVTPGTGSLVEGWTLIGSEGGTHTYTLDTNGIDAGEENKYIIVARNQAYLIGADGEAHAVTINGSTATLDTRDYEFWFTGSSSGLITQDGTNTLYQKNYSIEYGVSSGDHLNTFVNAGNGQYRIYDGDGTSRSLYYSNGSWTVTSSNHSGSSYRVRLYKYTGTEGGTTTYAKLEGTTEYTIAASTMTSAQILAMIQEGLTGYTSSNSDGSNAEELADSALTWTWDETLSPSTEGNYTMTVSYNGVTLGKVNVCIQAKKIASIEWPTEGYVAQYASANANVLDANGNKIMVKVTYEGGSTAEVPLTMNMLSKDGTVSTKTAGDIDGITITYGGKTNEANFTLHITEKYVNNYPEYPDEGAVKVNKTATGIDFQSSGVAQVELSASGVPVEKGADVIIMLDTSSSMTSHNVTGTSTTRAAVLEESLKDLIAQFKENGPNGEPLDIRVAIADFNGFYGDNHSSSGTPYDRDADDMMSDDIYYNANSEAKIYTGDGTLGAGAFVQNTDLANSYTLNYTSGTNYDYAMDAIYQLGYAIQQQNAANGEERDLFVIFMSDGAAMQWNYYHSQGASELWNEWITGTWDASDLTTTNLNCVTHKHYYDEVDHDGDGMYNEHRMANAIKGATDASYEVIRKTSDLGTPTGEENMYIVPGLGATMFSISFDATTDTNVLETSMDKSIASLASDQIGSVQYYYKVTSADELDSAFTSIGNEIAYAASNAVFKDQMGDAFSLQMSKHEYKSEGSTVVDSQIIPTIEVLSYDIYTRSEWVTDGSNADTVNTIGTRQDSGTVTEAVIFSDDGTKAYSTLIDVDKDGTYGATANSDGTYTISDADDNILGTDGVIYAQSFLYNTTNADMTITVGGKQITVAAESFYWNLGTVTTTEQALRYYVYLDGSMEGQREAGSYATNNYATLYYDNYLGNPCEKPTVSPSMAWESANVSYAFYLVDENGNVIVNQTTGFTGSFANKIAVTSPVVYEEIYLNNLDQVSSIEVASLGVLPEGYELYDSAAKYTVTINSNATGSWAIVKSDDKVASTYVTQYGQGTAYSNATSMTDTGNDYTHTVVWFAVVWKPQALPDTVVIDYGLPVDIHVLTNDMFGDNGTLAGIAKYDATAHDTLIAATTGNGTTIANGFGTEATGTYGTATATVGTGIVRYQVSDMNMSGKDVFTYAVNYTGTTNAGYYYDTVTVIPATTIYYEDSFLEFAAYDSDKNLITEGEQSWAVEGTTINATQGEDRPGEYSLPEVDANNVYGYDGAYTAMTEYSMGSARKIKVVEGESYGTAKFTFTGTGFDIVSLTSNTTGTIMVDVYQKGSSEVYRSHVVDSYYGYTYNETDGWVVSSAENSLYQVPVMKIVNLPYGSYDVTITAIYSDMFHHGQDGADKTADGNFYWFYLDAIRIYDPANDGATDESGTITDAYVKDNEGWPEYHELRNKIISQDNFNSEVSSVNGVVYIDGQNGASIADYTSYGPNNELYLTTGNAVAFKLGLTADQLANVADVQIGVKSADGKQVIATCFTASKAGVVSNEASRTITTTTDMYYSAYTQCTASADGIVVLKNTGEGIMSITNIKITYKSDPNAGSEDAQALATFAITPEGANYAVMALSLDYEEPDVETPTEPEVTEPEVTEPEATEPEIFEPETFEPETFDVRVDNSSVKVGSTVRVTVTTSDDVDHLVVNGETITWYRTNRGQGTRTWTVKVSADTVGELPIEIVAYNASGVAAAAFTETVTVTAQFTNIQNLIGHIVDGLVRKWF